VDGKQNKMAIFISVVGSEACCSASLMKEHSPDSRLRPGPYLPPEHCPKHCLTKALKFQNQATRDKSQGQACDNPHQLCSSLFNSIDVSCLHAKILTLDPPSADDFIQADVI
jgi:hypothetical protein